ncbi:hypothetical protein PISL3812_04174 [Talaromyces islandicus]|uniref:Transcription factor domain-containing protein n=1 Tax=Talaromyces islandicus TaxID=28573 RepID=A0A0U1LUS1_TALIS|nr:hypothetical protein PISL3812_04174 [Talaromyces islandicus]
MQLIWSQRRPALPRPTAVSDQRDGPFYLEPLSFRASLQVKDRNRSPKPRKARRFKFIAEKSLNREQSSTESHQSRHNPSSDSDGYRRGDSFQQINVPQVNPVDQHGVDPLPGILDDIDGGITLPMLINYSNAFQYGTATTPKPLNERNKTPDLFELESQIGDIENACMLNEPETHHSTEDMTSTMENVAMIRNSPIPICHDQIQDLMALGGPTRHETLFGKFDALLDLYDQNYCIVPLSGDIPSNPFRCRLEISHQPSALMHAVLAVSSYHAGRQLRRDDSSLVNVIDHQNAAMKLYDEEILHFTVSKGPQLLDTTMLLFMFKATQSAFSNWSTSISNAFHLLKLLGGPEFWVNNRKIQAQVVLLLWWDATIALLSRQGCLLPYSYFETLLALEDDRHWSFYDLIGCPRELVVPLMQLASLAEENEKVLSMRWARFDLAIINEIQTSILNWKNSSLEIENGLSEEEMHQQRDRWNCTEAWRYGLLTYITRVFLWNRKTTPPSRLAIYGRLILDHVNSCRRTNIVQKQAFFPLFLAGCETTDQFSRQSIREYCQYWDGFSGYNLFSTASSLLEEIWTEQAGSHGNTVWWGNVIDRKQQAHQSYGAPVQFCFG